MEIKPQDELNEMPSLEQPAQTNRNLLASPRLKSFLKSKWYPAVVQIPTFFIFGLIMYLLFFGPEHIEENFGSALTWILWWPLIPFFFLFIGRFWCAICPFATVSDLLEKIGLKKPIPAWLRKYGIWIIDLFLIIAIWVDHIFGIVENPRGSGYFLGTILIGVIIAALILERRAWCRYLCPIGGLSGNYSRTGMLELRATPEKCASCSTKACFTGSDKAPGCPVFEFPRTMDSSAHCNLCGHCIKSCPNDSIRLTPRMATKELWSVRKPKVAESFLAAIIMGIVGIQNLTMLEIWEPILRAIENLSGTTNYKVTFTIAYVVAMLIPLGMILLASAFANKTSREGLWKTFARFGYAIIPFDLAAHLAHNLLHLFNEGGALVTTYNEFVGAFMSMDNMAADPHSAPAVTGTMEMDLAILPMYVIKYMQYIFLAIGILGSWYCVRRISRNNPATNSWRVRVPFYVLLVVLGVINYLLFLLPMMDRIH